VWFAVHPAIQPNSNHPPNLQVKDTRPGGPKVRTEDDGLWFSRSEVRGVQVTCSVAAVLAFALCAWVGKHFIADWLALTFAGLLAWTLGYIPMKMNAARSGASLSLARWIGGGVLGSLLAGFILFLLRRW
jgi:hypothetical protein